MQITNRMYVDEKVIIDLIKEDSAVNKVKLDFIAEGLMEAFEREIRKLHHIGSLMRIVDKGEHAIQLHFSDFRKEVFDIITR